MKEIPKIIKELREAERIGKLKSLSTSLYEESQTFEEPSEASMYQTSETIKKKDKNESIENVDLTNIEEKYNVIFENYAIAITLVDKDEHIVSWNKYAEKLLNMGEEDLFMKHVSELYPACEWEKIRAQNIRQKGIEYKLETQMIKKDGSTLDVEISLSILKGREGKCVGSIGIIKDITELKTIEKKYLEADTKYKTIFENSAVAITLTDEYERIVSWNNYTENLLGLKKDDLYLKPVKSLYPSEEWKKIREQNVRQKGMQHHLETKIICGDKNLLDVDISLSVLRNHEGNIVGTIGVVKDISERKKIEEKLIYEHDLLESLLDNIPDSIYFKDKDSRFVKVNKAKAKHSNVSPDDMVGKTDFDFLKKNDAERIHLDDQKILKSGKPIINKIEKITDLKNVEHWISVTKIPRYDAEGNISGTMGISRDISNLKKAEERILNSEKKFRDIFDATSDFLIYIDPQGKILDVNTTMLSIGGLVKSNVVGKSLNDLKDLFSKSDLKKHIDVIRKAAHGVKLSDYECDLISSTGDRFRFLFSNDLIEEKGEVKGIILRGRDVTQRQRAWNELVRLEEKYRVLAETSADGVLTIDSLGRLTYVNPSFEKLCGRRKSQILATLFRDYLSDESVYLFQQNIIDVRKKDAKVENVELELVQPTDKVIPIEVNIAPFTRDSEFAGMVCTVRDITERRRVEDELKKSEKLKTEFMNIAAHELKSPVTPIKGYLDLIISDDESTDNIKKWANISLRNAERLLKLVNDILDVSRLDTDTMRFDMEKLNSVDVLDEIVEDMKPAVKNKNLKFITDIPRGLPHIIGDNVRISQVLKNLMVNAIKFTDKGSISISAEKKDDFLMIYVEDTGLGISNDESKKIFNKFYQAYTADDRKHEGTGLGLFICKQIVEKHNGKISVESIPGKGSKFIISLPYIHRMQVN